MSGVPLQQECQGSLGKNLAAKAGGEIQLGPDTKHVTQEGAGYNTGFGHSEWIVSIPPAGEQMMPKEIPLCWGALASPPDAMVHPGGCSRTTHLRWPRAYHASLLLSSVFAALPLVGGELFHPEGNRETRMKKRTQVQSTDG